MVGGRGPAPPSKAPAAGGIPCRYRFQEDAICALATHALIKLWFLLPDGVALLPSSPSCPAMCSFWAPGHLTFSLGPFSSAPHHSPVICQGPQN